MKNLNEKEWKVITLEDVFQCDKGVYLPTDTVYDGKIPFVTAKAENNGVGRFIGNKTLFPGNRITIEKVRLSAYYQPTSFYCSHDVSVLSNKNLNEKNALFISEMIMRNGSKYSYGRQAQLNVVKREKIMLPVDKKGNVDFKYMDDFSEQKRTLLLKRYISFVKKEMLKLGNVVVIPSLSEKQWKNFLVPNIFDEIQRGKRLKNADHVKGNIPYVSSTGLNNGVDDYVEATQGTRVFNDCVSLANSGSVGTAFYEPFKFVASDHVTSLKKNGASQFLYLFLSATLKKQSINFNFNREINDSRIRKLQIMLPVTDSGEPDYEYMEQYSKNIMLNKYKQYLDFVEKHYGIAS